MSGSVDRADAPTDATTSPDALWRARRTTSLAMFALVVLVAFESFAVTTVMPEVAAVLDGRALYAFARAAAMIAHGQFGQNFGLQMHHQLRHSAMQASPASQLLTAASSR